jgi:hypothetical protein
MTPSVEGKLDFVAHRCGVERAIPLGDIEYVDGKNWAAMVHDDPRPAPLASARSTTHGMHTKDDT